MKMEQIYIIFICVLSLSRYTDAVKCEEGWTAYKDELCLKVFDSFLNFQEANDFCSCESNEISNASMVMITDSDMQIFVTNLTSNISDHLWIGSRYDSKSDQFIWNNGVPVTYTTWNEYFQRNITRDNACVELIPLHNNSLGNWADVPCTKRNLVICQRPLSWTLHDAVRDIKMMRQIMLQATEERSDLQQQLLTVKMDLLETQMALEMAQLNLMKTQSELQAVNTKVVPVGFIYIEYNSQPNPSKLWPSFTWKDITDAYAGHFFRASGGESGGWGVTQDNCAPRITNMTSVYTKQKHHTHTLHIPNSGWSDYIESGSLYSSAKSGWYGEGIKFYTEACEVRPIN